MTTFSRDNFTRQYSNARIQEGNKQLRKAGNMTSQGHFKTISGESVDNLFITQGQSIPNALLT